MSVATRQSLTLVVAPAGWGKTTLVSSWLAHMSEIADCPTGRNVWITVTAADNDRDTFARKLWAACSLTLPEVSALENSIQTTRTSDELRQDLMRTLQALSTPLVLVLDDLHTVSAPDVADDLWALLRSCPKLRIVAIARQLPTIASPRAAASERWVTLGVDDLAYTPEESALALRPIDDTALRLPGIESWPAGVHMMVVGSADCPEDSAAMAMASVASQLEAYVESEVLGHLTPETVEFLTRVAVVDSFTTELAQQLDPDADAWVHIDALINSALLTRTYRPQDGFCFPKALCSVFRRKLVRKPAEAVRRWHAIASRWYLASGDAVAALEHADEACDEAVIGAAVKARWLDAIPDHADLLQRCLLKLPDHVRQSEAEYLVALAATYALHEADGIAAEAYLRQAAASAQTLDGLPLREAIVASYAAVWLHRRSSTRDAATTAGAAADVLIRANWLVVSRQLPHLAAMFYRAYAEAEAHSGRLRHGIELLATAIQLAKLAHLPFVEYESLGVCALLCALAGDLSKSEEIVARGTRLALDHGWLDRPDSIPIHLSAALLALERGAPAEAEALATRARGGPAVPLASYVEAIVHIERGHPARALAAWVLPSLHGSPASPASSAGQLSPLERGLYTAMRIRAFAALGQTVESRELLNKEIDRLRILEAPEAGAVCVGVLTAVVEHAETGGGAGVLAGLHTCLLAKADHPYPAYVEMLVLAMIAEYSIGNTESAVRHFELATSAAEVFGSWRAFLSPGRIDAVTSVLALVRSAVGTPGNGGAGKHLELLLQPQADGRETVALTPKEREVLRAMFHDLPSSTIARQMHVSPNTVKSQIRSIYRKLGVRTRDEALERAASSGLTIHVRDRRRHRTQQAGHFAPLDTRHDER